MLSPHFPFSIPGDMASLFPPLKETCTLNNPDFSNAYTKWCFLQSNSLCKESWSMKDTLGSSSLIMLPAKWSTPGPPPLSFIKQPIVWHPVYITQLHTLYRWVTPGNYLERLCRFVITFLWGYLGFFSLLSGGNIQFHFVFVEVQLSTVTILFCLYFVDLTGEVDVCWKI